MLSKKQIIISLSAFVLISGVALPFLYTKTSGVKSIACQADAKICPDGSSVGRSGEKCEFKECKSVTTEPTSTSTEVASSSTTESTSSQQIKIVEQVATPAVNKEPSPRPPTIINKVAASIVNLFNNLTSSSPTSSTINQSSNNPTAPQTQNNNNPQTSGNQIDETRYQVQGNSIVNNNGAVIDTFPPSSSGASAGWETHIVNVVPVGNTPPVVSGIPVVGSDGKYYVSENSFGNINACEFSNKIYILDVASGDKTLLFEENSSTLSKDDLRACNSEIFLLATEAEKLILKYHTINTNMTCEGSWSEPNKTWYLDVTNLQTGMKSFYISNELYTQSEQDEAACRETLGQ